MKMMRKSEKVSRVRRPLLRDIACAFPIIFLGMVAVFTPASQLIEFLHQQRKVLHGSDLFSIIGFSGSGSGKCLNCSASVRLGDAYGGWSICQPSSPKILRKALVYTVGVGRNLAWDEAMIARFGTVHHGWDPTPTALDFFSSRPVPAGFSFHPFGLAVRDGPTTLKLPHGNKDSYTVMQYEKPAQEGSIVTVDMLTLPSMMRKLGHNSIAILKIDIEGAEFGVVSDWHAKNYTIPADQVLIEFHARYFVHEPNAGNKVRHAEKQMKDLGFDLISRTHWVSPFSNFNFFQQFSRAFFYVWVDVDHIDFIST